MFTLIKRLQELLAKLKKNKGLWFTTLSVVSISGIFICMYVITTMTDRVSKEVYQSMTSNYERLLNVKMDNKKTEFEKIFVGMRQNGWLLNAIETNNTIGMEAVKNFVNEEFVKSGFVDLSIDIMNVTNKDRVFRNSINTVIRTKRVLFGTEVLNDGVFFVYIYPLERDGAVYGVLEIKESIHSLRNDFVKQGGEYVFLLDKKMLPFISLEAKTGKYKEVNQEYTLEQVRYDTKFAASMATMEEGTYLQFLKDKYTIDQGYFKIVKKITDINGADIGLIIVGESTEVSGGFVNIADNMTNTVTTVALGLVISIILFLF
ncbi:MAG: hypothetical protein ACNI3C_11475 [Candidatus Marinarcus sp.]|uniref:hypothetical protein n=1 Tax=Candidatus Marinarcus sp. TaxID=3100987 RepID=UPI003AFFD7AF